MSLLSLILWWCPTWLHCCVAVSQPAYSSGFCTHPNMQMHSAYCYCTVTPLTIEPGWYRRSSAVMRRSTSAAVMQRSTSSLSYCDVELRKGTAHLVFFSRKKYSWYLMPLNIFPWFLNIFPVKYIARKNASPHFNENNLLKYTYVLYVGTLWKIKTFHGWSPEEESLAEGSTYLTPTQRKNNEIKRLRGELNKAQEVIQARDREIRILR